MVDLWLERCITAVELITQNLILKLGALQLGGKFLQKMDAINFHDMTCY